MRRTAFRIWEVLDSSQPWQTLKKLTPRNSIRRNNLHIYAMSLFCRYFITIYILYLYSLQRVILDFREARCSQIKFYSCYDLSL